jgi:hypothetical protein
MATVGDFVTFGDNPVILKIGADVDRTYSITLPNNLNRNQNAVIAWRFEAEANPSSLNWKMEINGTQIVSFTHNEDRFCALQEVFSGSILNSGANNVTVTVLGGTGQIKVSDYTVHFQVDV